MNIGDKVRLLRGSEEGIITKIVDGKIIEVEIEEGFQIPVMRSEVVIISKEENTYFRKSQAEETAPAKPVGEKSKKTIRTTLATQGIFLAFTEINDQKLALNLINNTDLDLPFTMGEEQENTYTGITAGLLEARSSLKIKDVSVQTFERWPAIIIQFLFHKAGPFTLREPFIRKMSFKASSFFKSKKDAPVINRQAFLFQIDNTLSSEKSQTLDPEKLRESMLEPKSDDKKSESTINERPIDIVDLHIENLATDNASMSNAEMMELQLQTFEQKLDRAIAMGMDQITFIHGIGNGTLRNAIHKKLSGMSNIKFFKDAMREKFGYGATLIKIN